MGIAQTAANQFRDIGGLGGNGPVYASSSSPTLAVGSLMTASLAPGWTATGFQWTRDGVDIAGATSATYTLTASDVPAAGAQPRIIAPRVTGLSYAGLGAQVLAAQATGTPTYLGQVATGTFVGSVKAGSTLFGNKSIHTATDNLSALKVVWANWYVPGASPETGTGSVATIKATIEYPLGGTKVQFLFSGALVGNVPDLTEIESDFLAVNIPKGAEFAIYLSLTNTGGIPYFPFYAGDGRAQGMAAPTPDLTLPGSTGNWTTTASIGGTYAGPVGLVALTTSKNVMIVGDSISVGRGDSNFKYQGFLSRAFSPVCATGHYGSSGDRLSNFIASHDRRVGLARYYTHVAINMGINDTTGGASAATVQADTNTVIGYFTALGKKVAICTLGPVSTDSNNTWVSTGTQTTVASNAVRAAINIQRLSNTPLATVVYDPNPAIENVLSPEDGLWKASGGQGQTADGTHPNALGYVNQALTINTNLLLSV